jgi:hypothetical protein
MGTDRGGLAGAVDGFLFTPVRSDIAAVFRVALAAMLLTAFWPDAGVTAEAYPAMRDLYAHVILTPAYWGAVVTLAALLAAGVRSRAAGLALAVLLLPLVPLSGRRQGRQVLWFTLVAFSFLRSDAAFSLLRRSGTRGSAGPCWPVRLMQLQLSVLYAANALAKTTPAYLGGEVPAILMEGLPNFLVRPAGSAVVLGGVSIPLWVCATAVVAAEYALALGFWFRRTRWATAVLGLAFHGALRHVVVIGYLDVVSVFMYSVFLLPFTGPRRMASASGEHLVGGRVEAGQHV